MALTISNNNYAGLLTPGLSALISIGAKDYTLWHSATTNGSKVRLPYVDATIVLQDLAGGLCAMVDDGDRTLDFMNLDLVALGTQQSACIDELFATDYANAQVGGYLAQDIDPALLNAWGTRIAEKFSLAMENLRWSGDTTSLTPALAYHDGFVVQLLALGAYSAGVNDNGYQQVASTPVTSSNVVAEITKVIAKLPFEVTSHPDFKLVVGPLVATALQGAAMVGTGVNNVVMTNFDNAAGRITDNFFGFPVYQARGLGATAQNTNLIIGGIFTDAPEGVAKWGVNSPSDEKNIEVKLVNDGDSMRMRLASAQNVAVIPDGSQIAMNL